MLENRFSRKTIAESQCKLYSYIDNAINESWVSYRATWRSLSFEATIVYREVWEAAIGQILPYQPEGGNIHDPDAVERSVLFANSQINSKFAQVFSHKRNPLCRKYIALQNWLVMTTTTCDRHLKAWTLLRYIDIWCRRSAAPPTHKPRIHEPHLLINLTSGRKHCIALNQLATTTDFAENVTVLKIYILLRLNCVYSDVFYKACCGS